MIPERFSKIQFRTPDSEAGGPTKPDNERLSPDPLESGRPESERLTSDRVRFRGRFRTGLLLVSSAALGGIAVAVWNRRVLRELRSSLETASDRGPAPTTSADED